MSKEEKTKDTKQSESKKVPMIPLVWYRPHGKGTHVPPQPAIVLEYLDLDPPHRVNLQVFSLEGEHVEVRVHLDKKKPGCWFPIFE